MLQSALQRAYHSDCLRRDLGQNALSGPLPDNWGDQDAMPWLKGLCAPCLLLPIADMPGPWARHVHIPHKAVQLVHAANHGDMLMFSSCSVRVVIWLSLRLSSCGFTA